MGGATTVVFHLAFRFHRGCNRSMAHLPISEGTANLASAVLFDRYRERIHRYILSMAKDATEAEDLVQETFLRAHRQLASLRDPATVSAWLFRIATNVTYDRLRQRTREKALRAPGMEGDGRPAGEDLADPDVAWIDQAFEREEMSACVQEFIEELPDGHRAVLMLHDLEGHTNPEIAALLGCSLETVKIRLHRARKKLKAALAAGCDFSQDERGALVCGRHHPSQ